MWTSFDIWWLIIIEHFWNLESTWSKFDHVFSQYYCCDYFMAPVLMVKCSHPCRMVGHIHRYKENNDLTSRHHSSDGEIYRWCFPRDIHITCVFPCFFHDIYLLHYTCIFWVVNTIFSQTKLFSAKPVHFIPRDDTRIISPSIIWGLHSHYSISLCVWQYIHIFPVYRHVLLLLLWTNIVILMISPYQYINIEIISPWIEFPIMFVGLDSPHELVRYIYHKP